MALLAVRNVKAVIGSVPAGNVIAVPQGGNVQAAIDKALPGDTITLAAGATYIGNVILRPKPNAGMITIRSSAQDSALPGPSTRITPAYAGALPKLRSPSTLPALATEPGAHHYRLLGLEFGPTHQGFYDIIQLGDGSRAQNTLAMVPHHLELDRCYIHGDPSFGQKRGVGLNSASTTITNCYISDIKAVGQDSQAIAGWNGPGPYTITNNYLEAAGENLLIGGSDPGISGLIPSDILISRNHIARPLSWRGSNFVVKNLFELKNAQRVVVDGNILENNWLAGQSGYAILFTVRNQDGSAPWSVVQQVTFTNNIVRHVAGGINFLGTDYLNTSQMSNDFLIRNNLFEDVSGSYGGQGRFLLINGGRDVTIDHNTILQDGATAIYADTNPTPRMTLTNNIIPDHSWALMGAGTAPGNSTAQHYFAGGFILKNIWANANPNTYPANNYYPQGLAQVGFTNLAAGDYRLSPTSPYRNAGTDGKDVGADIGAILAATAGVS